MAEALAKKQGLRVQSAGTIPSQGINPIVVQAMQERNIDISNNHPRTLTSEMIEHASLVVTMGCSIEEACPKPIIAQMQKKLIEWHLDDPKGKHSKKCEGLGMRSSTRLTNYLHSQLLL
jgi:protein-tyrosine-phosphatase